MKDDRIGLFDTKGGITRQVAGPKVDGLYKYIQEENKKGKKFFGGIATNTDQVEYKTGRWIYFDKTSKDLTNDFGNWQSLDLN